MDFQKQWLLKNIKNLDTSFYEKEFVSNIIVKIFIRRGWNSLRGLEEDF